MILSSDRFGRTAPAAFLGVLFGACFSLTAHAGISVREIRNCTNSQSAALVAAEAGFSSRLGVVRSEIARLDLAHVRDTFVKPAGRPWVEGSPANQAYERYRGRLDQALRLMQTDVADGLSMECRDSQRDPHCQNGEVFAYVLFLFGRPQKRLYLCSGYFDLPEGQQRATLFHELSHYSASTDDLAMSWMDGFRSDIPRAAEDAYHFEDLADGDVERTLRRVIWFWNWPK